MYFKVARWILDGLKKLFGSYFGQSVIAGILSGVFFKSMSLLGIGFVTYTGTTLLIETIEQQIKDLINSVPIGHLYDLLAYIGFFHLISLFFVAHFIRITILGTRRVKF